MNQIGNLFKVEIFGESHGKALGVLLDGVPAGIDLKEEDFIDAIDRRRPNLGGTLRHEADLPKILSGVFNAKTTGAPILILFENNNTNSKDYSNLINQPRPSHADLVGQIKYKGFNDYRGGGAFSGRLTLGIVAAGVVAKKIYDPEIKATIKTILNSSNPLEFDDIILKAQKNKDSVGGIVEIRIKNPVRGLGEPYFDSFESVLSHALFSIPAVKGVSFGSGFDGTLLKGSEYNDLIINKSGLTKTNHDGGINGGITNGNEIIINVAIKPTPSIGLAQKTYDFNLDKLSDLVIEGRHDAAIIRRMPVILESAALIAMADLYLRNK